MLRPPGLLPDLGDGLWYEVADVEEKNRCTVQSCALLQCRRGSFGWITTILRWYSVVMKSHQLQNESGQHGISEVVSMDYEGSMGTEMQQTDDSVTSTTVDQADVEASGVNHYTSGQQCSTDSSNLKARPRPAVPGAALALKMHTDELTCVEMVVVQPQRTVSASLYTSCMTSPLSQP